MAYRRGFFLFLSDELTFSPMRLLFFLSILGGACFSSCTVDESGAPMPNILFCIADDASYPHMGAYGCDWVKTPAFDRVASQGILFQNCYTPNAKCAPSRACILTGRNSWQLEEAANHWPLWPQKFKTYAEALSDKGYHVGYTAKGWAPGIPGEIDGKRRELLVKAYNDKKTDPPASYISNIDYSANFEDFLNDNTDASPFCFWYGSTEPHRAYEFRAGIEKGGKRIEEIDAVPAFWPDNDTIRTDMLDYAFEIEYFDGHLQRMLDMLERRDLLDHTLVIVTADNGMPFPKIKGQEYEMSNHLPLAIMWKDGIKNPGRVISDYVNFIDFAPTYLELAGLTAEMAGLQPITGRSLTDIFYSEKSGIVNPLRDHVLIGKERHDVGRPHDWGYPIRGIVRDGYLYLHNYEPGRWPAGNPETGYLNCDGSPTKTSILNDRRLHGTSTYWQGAFGKRPSEELYLIKEDPQCMNNLATSPDLQEVRLSLRKQMEDELAAQEDPRMLGKGQVFDDYPYMDKKTQSFYERYMAGEEVRAGWVEKTDFESAALE